jgi:acyl-CoA dehydrogenase
MDFSESPTTREMREHLSAFFEAQVLPRHREWHEAVVDHRQPAPFMASLRAAARAQGLWNLALPQLGEDEPGTRLSNLEFSGLCEIMGRLPWGSEAFNCQAPDVPNMALLQQVANAEQKQRWLRPLLEGQAKSAFALTEPDQASSDATNIDTRIVRRGDQYVINGRKWFITGAAHPDCKFVIVVGRSNPDAERTRQHSTLVVPMDTPGLRVLRAQRFMGWEDHVAPVGELEFVDVTVPAENLLGAEGSGFSGAQTRLGPARVHHCMRQIGLAEVLMSLMIARAKERKTFGRAIIDYDTVQRSIAQSRVEIEMARIMVQRTAWLIDKQGHRGSWRDVSICKIAVPDMLQKVVDRATQIFGAMGGSDQVPIHHAYAYARGLRIGDGPDEVHLRQIFRTEQGPDWTIAQSPYVVPFAPSRMPAAALSSVA